MPASFANISEPIPNLLGHTVRHFWWFLNNVLISGPANKIDTPSRPPGTTSSYSEIKPMLDLNSIAMGVLGVAALGTVGFGVYSANSSKNKKRRISYRSVPDEEELWLNVAKGILKGKKNFFLNVFLLLCYEPYGKETTKIFSFTGVEISKIA